MKKTLLIMALLLATGMAGAADTPVGPASLDGKWKLDWDRSDPFEPIMKALETPWLMRRLAGIARVGLELRAVAGPEDCGGCAGNMVVTLSTPISTNKVEVTLDGKSRPGKDPRGRATLDQYSWAAGEGLTRTRKLERPSGSQARLVEVRRLGGDSDTLLSQLTVWIDDSQRASIERVFIRTGE